MKKIDVELYNRIFSHSERLLYHANNILRLSDNEDFKHDKQKLNELKTSILYHDISKCIDFEKYNAERKKDHALFSAIILETAMIYLEFSQEVINRITKNVMRHSDKCPVSKNTDLDYAGLLLMDVDILDEQDIYGVLLLMAVKGNNDKIVKNNFMNHKDAEKFLDDFIDGTNALDTMNLSESKKYYNTILDKILMIKNLMKFENEEVFM